MTEFDKIFIQDILYRIELAMKSVKGSIYELVSFTDELNSDDIQNNLEIINVAINNIKEDILSQQSQQSQEINIDE